MSHPSTSHTQTLRQFFKDLERLDFAAVAAHCSEVWRHPTGERASLPVRAVSKFHEGRIELWRDYWDVKTLFDPQPSGWLERIVARQVTVSTLSTL